jgi:glycosyltransferase involved in cell wall biosynthesis
LVDRTHFTGFVNDALLPDLYAAAEMFVYPSLYEGFGLPVLEAMACGAPVISSTTSSLPEVAGAAGLLIDPYDAEGLADAIRHLLDAPTQRERMREQGLRQAARFSWSQTAVEAMKIYARVNA